MTINVTLNTLTIVLVGLVGMFLGVVVLGSLLDTGHFGFVGSLLLAIAGAIVTVVLAHLALLVRQLATAS